LSMRKEKIHPCSFRKKDIKVWNFKPLPSQHSSVRIWGYWIKKRGPFFLKWPSDQKGGVRWRTYLAKAGD
jgi:hypothetical protein